jgi:hypothetical protein
MAGNTKKTKKARVGSQPLITVDPSIPSFEGHTFFEKKAATAKALLKKVGLPKQLEAKSKG